MNETNAHPSDIMALAGLVQQAALAERAESARVLEEAVTGICRAGSAEPIGATFARASEAVECAVAGAADPPRVRLAGGELLARLAARCATSLPRSRTWRDADVRLDALRKITRTTTMTRGLDAMLRRVVQDIADTTFADAVAIFLYDDANDLLTVHAGFGVDTSAVGVVSIRATALSVTGRAARELRTIVVPDGLDWSDTSPLAGLGNRGLRAQASVPLVIGGDQPRLVGVLNTYTREPRSWDEIDIEFFETVANELAISIENIRLYGQTTERLERKIHELSTLQRLSREIASTLDSGEVLRSIVEAARSLIRANAAAVFTLGEHEGRRALNVDYRVGEVLQVRDHVERTAHVRRVIETGVTVMQHSEYIEGHYNVLCLPLRSARNTFGALCLRLEPTQAVTDDDLAVLQAFSDSAAIAMENAKLYDEMRGGVARSSLLLQEMHHRVRNNLQTVAALLSLQMRQAETTREGDALREATSRIQAIAAVHDLLSDERRLGGATIAEIARLVADDAHNAIIPPGLQVTFSIQPSDVVVPSRTATIFALLINELVANAVRHGFGGRKQGTITVRSSSDGGMAMVEVENDGDVIAAGFNPSYSTGLGMRIVNRLVTSDLRGVFSIAPAESGRGTVARIRFPLAGVARTTV